MVLRSGLPIVEGLRMLKEESASRSGAFVYERLIEAVSRGQLLSRGLSEFEHAFGTFAISIVRVGEASGTLQENLDHLAEELRRQEALRRKVLGALIYPAIIITASIGIVVLLTVFVFPKIIPIFQSVKATLPWSTRMLIAISLFLKRWGIELTVSIAVIIVGTIALIRTDRRVRIRVHRALLYMPVIGRLSRSYNVASIARTLSLLLKSEVHIVPALELVEASIGNLSYREALASARERISRGQRLSAQLRGQTRLFPAIAVQMIAVGESTGDLTGTLSFVSDMYESEIDELTRNLTTMLEPVLMITMGLVVGFIAISIISPIYSITSSLSPH
jgi:type II secretory pathway component PulF